MRKFNTTFRLRSFFAAAVLVVVATALAFAVPPSQLSRQTGNLTFNGPCCMSFGQSVAVVEPSKPMPVAVTWNAQYTFGQGVIGGLMVNAGPWSVFPPFADDVGLLLNGWRRLAKHTIVRDIRTRQQRLGQPLAEAEVARVHHLRVRRRPFHPLGCGADRGGRGLLGERLEHSSKGRANDRRLERASACRQMRRNSCCFTRARRAFYLQQKSWILFKTLRLSTGWKHCISVLPWKRS